MTRIIGIDPGGTTGVFAMDETGKALEIGEHQGKTAFFSWLENQVEEDTIWVVEDYKIRPPKYTKGSFNHNWDRPIAVEIIGAIYYHAHCFNQTVKLSQPSVKPVGYGFAGKKYVKGKSGGGIHQYDALAHALHFVVVEYGVIPWSVSKAQVALES